MKRFVLPVAGYGISICLGLFLLILILNAGPQGEVAPSAAAASGWLDILRHEISRNMQVPLTGLLVQVLAILVFSRLCSYVLGLLGQPQVVGEMVAGILLGKSVLGFLWPAGFAGLFPESSMPRLYFLSQIGLIFFMFVVGLDLKLSGWKARAPAAVLVSHVSIVFPFLLGALVATGIYGTYGPANIPFSSFALFMGIAMSITAFPVLARILQERKLTHTSLGVMAITCAAVDDVTAWCVLAAVLGIVKAGTMSNALVVLLLALAFVGAMLALVRPMALRILRPATLEGNFTRGQLATVFCVLLGSALVAEIIGIHALFGAFLAGAIMPQSVSFRSSLMEKIEDLSAVVLLPIFFAYTGIRTEIHLLDSWHAWLVCAGIIALAVVGKMVGSALAARWSGIGWRESWALGTLMNTRGLMELVVLNIGYDLGILPPTIFAMMVVMAIGTTLMTGPLLSLCLPQLRREGALEETGQEA
jgi:Kef-type K+ transport system membrane component KefB